MAATSPSLSLSGRFAAWQSRNVSLPLDDRIFFTENLRVMVKAGVPLSDSLATLAKQAESARAKTIFNTLRTDVEAGRTLSSSAARFPHTFPRVFVSMLEVGELSGTVDGVLEELTSQMKKEYALRSKVRGAMIYPTVVLVAMLGITIGLIAFVLPKLLDIFKEFSQITLPLPTRILIAVSDAVQAHGVLMAVLAVLLVAGLVAAARTAKGRLTWHGLLLRMPIVGPISRQVNLARLTRTLSGLLRTDIPVVRSFTVTADVLRNVHFRIACLDAAERVKKGATIADGFAAHEDLFPPLLLQMAAVGESTGAIDDMLETVAEYYEAKVTNVLNNLSSIIEPILILVLGFMVGGIALAVLTPMYALTQAVAEAA